MRFVNKFKENISILCKKKVILLLILFFTACPFIVEAADVVTWWEGQMLDMLSSIVYAILVVVGQLIGAVISVFLIIIEYNTFINADPVIIGWEIIRDICNMGFVIVLLIIAIASILQIQTYLKASDSRF